MANTQLNDSLFYSDTNIYYNDKEILFNHTNLLKPNSFNLTSVKDDEGNTFYELWFVDKDRQLTQLTYNILEGNGISLDENKRWKINMDNITIQENQDNQLYINNEYIIKAYGSQTKGVIKVKNENPHINIYEPNNNIGSIIINDRGQISISPTILGLISQIEESKSTINSLIEEIDKMLNLQQFDNSTDLTVGDIIYYNDFIGFSKYTTSIKDDPNWRPYYVCVISSGVLPDGKARIMNINKDNSVINLLNNINGIINEAVEYSNIPVFNGNYNYNNETSKYEIDNLNIKPEKIGYIATDSLMWKKYYNPLNNIEHYGIAEPGESQYEGENNINIIGMYIDNRIGPDWVIPGRSLIMNNFQMIVKDGLCIYIADEFKHIFSNITTITIPKIKMEIPMYFPKIEPVNGHSGVKEYEIGYFYIEYDNVILYKVTDNIIESDKTTSTITSRNYNVNDYINTYGQTYTNKENNEFNLCHKPVYCILKNQFDIIGSNIKYYILKDINTKEYKESNDSLSILNNISWYNILPCNTGIRTSNNMPADCGFAEGTIIDSYNNLYPNNYGNSNPYLYGNNMFTKLSNKALNKLSLPKSNDSELLIFGAGEQVATVIRFEFSQSSIWLNSSFNYIDILNKGTYQIVYDNTYTINFTINTNNDSQSNSISLSNITISYSNNYQYISADYPSFYKSTLVFKNVILSTSGITLNGADGISYNIVDDNNGNNEGIQDDLQNYTIKYLKCIVTINRILYEDNLNSIIQNNFYEIVNKQIKIYESNELSELDLINPQEETIKDVSFDAEFYHEDSVPGENPTYADYIFFYLHNTYITISDENGSFDNPKKFNSPEIPENIRFCDTYFPYTYYDSNQNKNSVFEFPTKYYVQLKYDTTSNYRNIREGGSSGRDEQKGVRFIHYIPSDDEQHVEINTNPLYFTIDENAKIVNTHMNIFDYYSSNETIFNTYKSYYIENDNTYIFSGNNAGGGTYFDINDLSTKFDVFYDGAFDDYKRHLGASSLTNIYNIGTISSFINIDNTNYNVTFNPITNNNNRHISIRVPYKFYIMYKFDVKKEIVGSTPNGNVTIYLYNNAFVDSNYQNIDLGIATVEYGSGAPYTITMVNPSISKLFVNPSCISNITHTNTYISTNYYNLV